MVHPSELSFIREKVSRGEQLSEQDEGAWLPYMRRMVDRGAVLSGPVLNAVTQANAAALDVLARIGVGASAPPCGQAGTSRWCPLPLGHGGPCTVDWAVVEGPADPDPDPEGPKPSCIDRLRAAFEEGERLDATMTEAEKEMDRRINPVPWYRGQNGRKGAE